jgi:hypothetical protein
VLLPDQFRVPTQLVTPLGKKFFINKEEADSTIDSFGHLSRSHQQFCQRLTSKFGSATHRFSRSKPKQQSETSSTFFHNKKLQALVPAEHDIIINFVHPRQRNM